MTTSGRPARPEAAADIPSTEEALSRLDMPLGEAMRTQRAIRKLHLDPVSHDVLLPLLELSLKAPTSSNTQDWSYLVVEDPEQKARLARLYRRLYRLFNPVVERQARGDEAALRGMRPGQWQAEHFEELPLFVIPCYSRNLKHRPVGRPQISVASFYGSVYPAVQNLLLAARGLGLGGAVTMWQTMVEQELREILGISPEVALSACVTLGYPQGHHGPVRRRPLSGVVYDGTWGNEAAWAVDPPDTRFTRWR